MLQRFGIPLHLPGSLTEPPLQHPERSMHSTPQSAPATEVTNVGGTMKAAQKMISSFAVRFILFAYIGVTRDFHFAFPASSSILKAAVLSRIDTDSLTVAARLMLRWCPAFLSNRCIKR